jgi:primary-amine oxidase
VWTAGDAAAKELTGSDPVIWYSFGLTHLVRPEDFPIMPCEVCSFSLKPAGFFTMNPAMDLPKVRNAASKEDTAASCCGTNGTNGTNGNGFSH